MLDGVAPGRGWAWDASAGLGDRAARLLSALLDSTGDPSRPDPTAVARLAAERDADGAALAADLADGRWPAGRAKATSRPAGPRELAR